MIIVLVDRKGISALPLTIMMTGFKPRIGVIQPNLPGSSKCVSLSASHGVQYCPAPWRLVWQWKALVSGFSLACFKLHWRTLTNGAQYIPVPSKECTGLKSDGSVYFPVCFFLDNSSMNWKSYWYILVYPQKLHIPVCVWKYLYDFVYPGSKQ